MADSLQTIDNYDKVETINKNRIRKKKIMAEHIEYLKLTPGFRTALADGVLVPDSPKHMTTGFICAKRDIYLHLLFFLWRETQYICIAMPINQRKTGLPIPKI